MLVEETNLTLEGARSHVGVMLHANIDRRGMEQKFSCWTLIL